ncbi:MAG: LuxR C-terminal-related transcriptional regulator [Micrococcaceae bacterium]|nr:LuxR C-terminal-related transcriptional regulator [Micrococcaceae bacterium]
MGSQSEIVEALLRVAASSRESAVILRGIEGIGKSTILEKVSEALGNRPHRLLRANPSESTWPLSGLMAMLASVQLADPFNITQRIPADRTCAVDQYALAREIQEKLLDGLSVGTVIMIDDADHLDADSQAVIGYLGARLGGTGISLIATVTDPHANSAWAAIKLMEIGPLTIAESLEVAARHAGTEASAAVLKSAIGFSDGRPGTIVDVLDRLTPRQLSGTEPLEMPLKPGDAAKKRVEREFLALSDAQQQIMNLSAMAPLAEARAVTEVSPESRDALDDLLADGRLRHNGPYIEVSSALERSALYWNGSAAQRRMRHERLAENTSSLPLATYHRSFAETESTAAQGLLKSASELTSHGYFDFGIETMERAMRLGMFGPDNLTHFVGAVETLVDTLELEQASRIVRMAMAQTDSVTTVLDLALLNLKLDLLLSNSAQHAAAEPLAQKYRTVEPVRCAGLLCFAAVSHGLNGDLQSARRDLLLAEEISPALGEGTSSFHAQACLIVAALEQRIDPVLAVYRNPPATGDHFQSLALGFALSEVGRPEESGKVFAGLLAGHSNISPLVRCLAQLFNAKNELRANTFSGALTAIDAWRKTPPPVLLAPLPQILHSWYWLSKDKPERALPHIASAHETVAAQPHSRHAALIAAIEGEYALMRDNLDTAIAHFRRAQLTFVGSADGDYVRMLTNLIEALVLNGKFEEAANEYRAAQSLMATAPGRRNRLVTRRAHAMARPGATSLKLFQSLLDEWATGDSRFEYARLLHAYATRLAHLGQIDEARIHFLAARSLFVGMQAKGWAQRIDAQLTQCAVAPKPGLTSLSLSRDEMHIIELLKRGRTNKEICNELFVALSTVEVRLSKLFKKTGASNRHHLVSLFAA